jgi:hypothetical protein
MAMNGETVERLYKTAEPASVYISNIRGSVSVTSGAQDEVHVVAVMQTDTGDAKSTQIIIEQDSNGRVNIETRFPPLSGLFNASKPCQVDYQVRVPERCDLSINAVSSSCSVSGLVGNLRIKTVSGEHTLSQLGGKIDLKSVSGDILASNLNAELDIDSVSGDGKISQSRLLSVQGKTVSGDLFLDSGLSEGPYSVSTVSGNVHLKLPEGQNVFLKLTSLSGTIVHKSGQRSSRSGGGTTELGLGSGGPLFRVKSVSGDLVVDSQTSAENYEADAPYESFPAENQESESALDVLQGIEDGTISVEEGLERLKNLK